MEESENSLKLLELLGDQRGIVRTKAQEAAGRNEEPGDAGNDFPSQILSGQARLYEQRIFAAAVGDNSVCEEAGTGILDL